MSYIEVINKLLDSKDVTVGGGSASAITGAIAAGLIGMVARLSTKIEFGLTNERYSEIADELDVISKELTLGSEDDTKAYLLIKEAYSMPKDTVEEKEKRNDYIQKAGYKAAIIPKDNAYRCRRIYELGIELDGKSNKAAYSDLAIGISLAKLGVYGCVMNIEANLSLIKDEEIQKELLNHIRTLALEY